MVETPVFHLKDGLSFQRIDRGDLDHSPAIEISWESDGRSDGVVVSLSEFASVVVAVSGGESATLFPIVDRILGGS